MWYADRILHGVPTDRTWPAPKFVRGRAESRGVGAAAALRELARRATVRRDRRKAARQWRALLRLMPGDVEARHHTPH
eukprot:SAG11_NODE_30819_length_297_cov_0.833333_1_plen_77_part_01